MSSKRVSYATWMKMSPAQRTAKRKALARAGGGSKRSYVPRVKGKGAYSYSKPGPWGRYGRAIGSQIGSHFLSPYIGKSAASSLGATAGGLAHYIGRIFGSGDYIQGAAVKSNSIISPQAPSFASGATTVTIKHREFLGDVISSGTAGAFSITSFPINPGLASSYPWLSQVCGSTFQQYRVNGQVYEFRSMSSDALNSTNTALGQVIMCTDYDSADAAFTSKQQMENTEFGVSCKPSCNMIHAIECEPRLTTATELYVRAGSNPANTDIRLYDWGRTYVATNGCQGQSVNLGELWVSYDITFFKTIEQPPGYLIPTLHMNIAATSGATPLLPDTSVNKTQPVFNSLGATVTNTTIVMPLSIPVNSNWIMIFFVRGGSTASINAPNITPSNGLVGGWGPGGNLGFINNGSQFYSAPQTATGNTSCCTYIFYYSGGGTVAAPPTLTFSTGATFPGTPQGGDVMVMMVPGQIQ
jgi:hypothetical protein